MPMAVGQRFAEEEPTALSTTGSAAWDAAGRTVTIQATVARAANPIRLFLAASFQAVGLIGELGETGQHQAVDGDRLRQVAEAHHRIRKARELGFRHLPGGLEEMPFAHE